MPIKKLHLSFQFLFHLQIDAFDTFFFFYTFYIYI